MIKPETNSALAGAEPVAWRVRVNENGRIWYVYTELLPYTPDDHIKVLSEPEPLYAAPQAVPAEDIAAMASLLRGRIGENFDGECHLTEAEALQITASLTSLSAERDRLQKLVSNSEVERYRSCSELLERAAASEAEATSLRRKLEAAIDECAAVARRHLAGYDDGDDGFGVETAILALKRRLLP